MDSALQRYRNDVGSFESHFLLIEWMFNPPVVFCINCSCRCFTHFVNLQDPLFIYRVNSLSLRASEIVEFNSASPGGEQSRVRPVVQCHGRCPY
jgi:hypothetical protein